MYPFSSFYSRIFIAGLLMISSNLLSQEYITHYQQKIKGDHWKTVCDFVKDAEGNLILTGSFEKEISIDKISYYSKYKRSLFVASFDSIGQLNWLKILDSPGLPSFIGVELSSDQKVFLLGSFKDSLLLDEHYLACTGSNNIFHLQLSTEGGIESFKILLPDFPGRVISFRLDSMNNLALGGEFKRSLNLGNTKLISKGKEDIFILAFSSEDKCTTAFSFGSKGSDRLKGIFKHGEHELVYGTFERDLYLADTILNSIGQSDIFLSRFSSSWQMISSISIGGSGSDDISVVYPGWNTELLIAGSFEKTLQVENQLLDSHGGKDIFLCHFSDSLALINSRSWGGMSDDFPFSMTMEGTGQLFLTGIFKEKICFGLDTLISSGRFSNGFIICLSDSLEINWTKPIHGNSEVIPRQILSDGEDLLFSYGTFHGKMADTDINWKSRRAADIFLFSYRNPCSSFKLDLPAIWYLCPGEEDTIKAAAGYSSYLWNDGLSSGQNLSVTEPGVYWLRVSDDYGCIAIDSLKLVIDSLTVLYDVTDECMPEGKNGSIELFVSGGIKPIDILWEDGSTGNFIGDLSEGTYNVEVSDSAGCAITRQINVGKTYASGILDIQVFPNPMSDLSQIVYSIPNNTWMEIALYDIAGRKLQILYSGMNRKGKYELEWETGQIENGVYYIRIQTNEGSVSRRIVIAHD